jgi:hypothetical protein
MSLKRSLLAIIGCGLLLGCGGGAEPTPQPLGTEEPSADPQQPQAATQDPEPDSQTPEIGVEEPAPNAQDPLPAGARQQDGTGGASPGAP